MSFSQAWLETTQTESGALWSSPFSYFFVDHSPLYGAAFAAAAAATFAYVASIPTHNYSWVDKLWSIVPPLYVLYATVHLYYNDVYVNKNTSDIFAFIINHPRLPIMSLLTSLWGIRLTYNFARKGGYGFSAEDYRWAHIRARYHPILFQLLNLTFIAFYQNLLLLLITTPAYIVLQAELSSSSSSALTGFDYVSGVAFLLLLFFETWADQQQWQFHKIKQNPEKYKQHEWAGCVANGFLSLGLFRYCRHPAFFCEQSIWFSFYFFSVGATGSLLNWSLIGSTLLIALFQASTDFTESISVEKYPKYKEYQRTTNRLCPNLCPKQTISKTD